MLTNRFRHLHARSLSFQAKRAFAQGPLKLPIEHSKGMKEEIRPQYTEMYNELESMMNAMLTMLIVLPIMTKVRLTFRRRRSASFCI